MFKKFSLYQFSLVVTFMLLVLLIISEIILHFIPAQIIYIILVHGIMLFVFFFLLRFLTGKLVFDKLEPLYASVHSTPDGITGDEEKVSRNDMIEKVHEEVQKWAAEKSLEIIELKKMEKYRREFLGNVSHELKTPIFNIQGYILTLLEGGIDDSTINKLYLERSEKSINRMISIVEDLESISRLESGTFSLDLTRFDLIRLAEEVYENLEMQARKKGVSLVIKKPFSGKPIWIVADRKRIYEAISNLVINSIVYGRENGKTIISCKDQGDHYLVTISDNGIGMQQKELPRIFERFYRVEESRSRNQRGTGLGLAIVKHIIEAHNQHIEVKSILRQGSEFSFTLKKG